MIPKLIQTVWNIYYAGADTGGGAHPARAPPNIGKKYDFLA